MLEQNKPSLNQITSLTSILDKEPDNFGIYNINSELSWKAWTKMSIKQYKYLLHLIFSKKYFKAKEILDQLGVEHKITN